MKKTALIVAVAGAIIALFSYIARETGVIDIKAFFKIGFVGLGLMVLSSAYFLIAFIAEWGKENDFFKRIL